MAPPFAYDPAGTLLAAGDGPELIGYDGDSEAPLFRFVHDANLLNVQISSGVVWALDDRSRLLWLTNEGAMLGQLQLEAGARALSPVRNGRAVVVLNDGAVAASRDGQLGRVRHPKASAAALDVSGSTVLVGDADGALTLFNIDGMKVTALSLPGGGPVSAVASAPGCWFASVGAKIFRVDGSLRWSEIFVTVSGEIIEQLATQDSKRLVAARMKGNKGIVLGSARQKLASGRWLDKEVGDFCFGPLPWIGVGLSAGDGNKVNLITGAMHRTDTHPERKHNRWMVAFGPEDGNQAILEAEPAPLVAPAAPPAAARAAPNAPAVPAPPSSSGLTQPPQAPQAAKKPIPPVVIGLIATVVALPLLCIVLGLIGALIKH